jgi:ABC-2 type transport system ATP-binding protein
MEEAMLHIEFLSICKAYKPGFFKKPVHAVSDLTLSIERGEVFGLVGPNGAGKSTTIRMLLALTRPDHGEIRVGGTRTDARSFLRDVGYLPENPYLYDHLTLRELLHFNGAVSGLTRHQIAVKIASLTQQIGVAHAMDKPLRTFSKGMKQRAGLCFALLHDPSLVILDEPMSGLDPLGRRMVCDLILGLKKQGKTVFFCSHILSDVERLCDRIAILDKGHLVRSFTDLEMNSFRSGETDLEQSFIAAVSSEDSR